MMKSIAIPLLSALLLGASAIAGADDGLQTSRSAGKLRMDQATDLSAVLKQREALSRPAAEEAENFAARTPLQRFEGEDNRNNEIIRQVAKEFMVPLWDFDLLAETLPGRGMGSDNVHLTLFDYYDYNMDLAYETGYGLYNLTALMMLDEIWREVSDQVP